MAAKAYKRLLPKALDKGMIARLEQAGMSCHDNRTIAAQFGCTEEEIEDRRETDRLFEQAIIRGKAMMLDNAAKILAASMQGTGFIDPKTGKLGSPPTIEMVQAAKFYLEHQGPNWQRE